MTKKRVIIIICSLIFMLLALWLWFHIQRAKGMIDFPKTDITRAYIIDGNNGNTMELKGSALDLIYNGVKNASVKPVKDEEASGWSYTVYFERGNQTTGIEMISPKIWKVSEKWYEVSESDGEKIMRDISKMQ